MFGIFLEDTMREAIETKRLIIKPLKLRDAPEVFELASDPAVNRFMCYRLHQSIDDTKAWLRTLQPNDLEFAFFRKEDGRLIGTGGIGKDVNGRHTLGYQLRSDAWGNGYATEAARALIAWGHIELGINDYYTEHAIQNVASEHVIRKCGFQFVRYGRYERFDRSEVFDAAFYELHLKGEADVCR